MIANGYIFYIIAKQDMFFLIAFYNEPLFQSHFNLFQAKKFGQRIIYLEFNMSITNVQIKIHFQVFDRTCKCWFTVVFSPQFDSLYTPSTTIKEHQLVSPDPLVVRGTPRLGQTEISSSGVAKNWRQWNCKQVMRLSVLDLITVTVNKN